MEVIGLGLQAIGSAVGGMGDCFWIYICSRNFKQDIFNIYGQRKKRRF